MNISYKLDIILPVYNEEDNIDYVIREIEKNVRTPHRILAIWQDEKDLSLPILKKLSKQFTNLKLVQSRDGVGVVKSLKEGIKNSNADYITVMMSDRSDNPKDIDKMVKLLDKGYDLVCASRYSNKGKRLGGPKIKGFLSFIGCITLKMLTNINTNDATNAFKTFKKTLLDKIIIESVGGFELPLEIAVKAHVLGLKITEIPTIWKERESGKSKFKLLNWLPQYIKWYAYAIKKNTRQG